MHPTLPTFHPGLPWLDDRGRHIQAHGGAVTRFGDTWFWVGEDRSRENDPARRHVALYSSQNLADWKFRGQILQLENVEQLNPRWVAERPKLYFNARTQKYVLYFHLDAPLPGSARGYKMARVGVATCDRVDGAYEYQRSFRPLGLESRDIGQYIDDDGTAYLIFEERPSGGFHIARLSEDFLEVESLVCSIRAPLEGGALVRYEGLYYMIGSLLTGWWPNPNKYAVAEKLEGPWSEFKDFAPPTTNTYLSQSTNLVKVVGSKTTAVIYLGDIWRPQEQWDSRYLWMPLEIGDGRLWLPAPREWTLDLETGETQLQAEP